MLSAPLTFTGREMMNHAVQQFERLARVPLAYLPTPLVRLTRLETLFGGPRIFMKRDDQTGLGFGGNKTRKLEYLLGDATRLKADCLITAGAAQSNHCRQTAAAAAASGLGCHLALGGTPPPQPEGNLLLDLLFGAHIHWSQEKRKGENIPEIVKVLRSAGKHPYIIPYGGSNHIGAMGYVAAMFELEDQSRGEIEIDHIFFASSSGGTHAGMMVGKEMLGKNYQLHGVNIDKDEIYSMELEEYIVKLANEVATSLEFSRFFTPDDVLLHEQYLGEGYGVVGALEREAIAHLARREGILLDPVYTGRAMGGMLDLVKKGHFNRDETLLFWHTGGGPALFAYGNELV